MCASYSRWLVGSHSDLASSELPLSRSFFSLDQNNPELILKQSVPRAHLSFSLFQFVQCLFAAAAFFYSSYASLTIQLALLAIFLVLGVAAFLSVEVKTVHQGRDFQDYLEKFTMRLALFWCVYWSEVLCKNSSWNSDTGPRLSLQSKLALFGAIKYLDAKPCFHE